MDAKIKKKLTAADKQHIARMMLEEQRVNSLYWNLVRAVSTELRGWKEYDTNNVWVRNTVIERKIDNILLQLNTELEKEVSGTQKRSWDEAIIKNDDFVRLYIQKMALSEIAKQGMFKRNYDALRAFQTRKDSSGLTLSKRVWTITEQTKTNIETYLGSGIATGRSAEGIGRDLRQLLKDPNKRFRRVRNEKGKLQYSKPMKDYNPGMGVYRSSRMNAVRLAVTETNRAYRLSDALRWQQLGFVLGTEIRRSRNGEPCKVCDSLVGKYPTDFTFTGFHPFCICFATPIVLDHKDFADYLLNDKVPEEKVIKDIPDNAKEWYANFLDKSPNAKLPYFVLENQRFFEW